MVVIQSVLVLWLVVQVIATPTAHVILICGQSNSMGYNTDGPTAEDVTFPNILQISCCAANRCKLIIAQDPLHHNCTPEYLNSQNVGFGMSFARKLREDIPEEDIIVMVPAGLGNSGFVDDVWTAYTGSGFRRARCRLEKTFKLLAKHYPEHTGVFAGILWHQGEKDAGVKISTWDYLKKELIPMIEAWRDDKIIPQTSKEVPFVVGNLLPSWAEDRRNKGRRRVPIALQLVNLFVPFTGVATSQGLVGDVSEGAEVVHFSAKSQRVFGKRYYEAWKAAKLNNNI